MQGGGDLGAHPAAAGNHYVTLEAGVREVHRLELLLLEPALLEGVEAARLGRDHRGEDHGQHRGGQDQVVEFTVDGFGRHADLGKDKRELADLEQPQADRNGDDVAVAEQPGERGEDEPLAHADEQHQEQDGTEVVEQEAGVDEHAHRGEKEQAEDVAQGDDVTERLVTVVGLVEHHAGDEGTEGERQPHQIGGVTDAEADGDDRQEEQLAAAEFGDLAHQPGQQLGAEQEHGGEEDGRLEPGLAELDEPGGRVVHQRQEDDHGHDGQVLDDEHADHHLARQGAEPALVHQRLEQHHGAREADHGPEPHRGLQVPAHELADAEAEPGGQEHLQGRADQGDQLDRLEVLVRELKPQGEQQQCHADLGQPFDVVHRGDGQAAGVRPEDDAGQDVAEDQRLAQPLHEQAAEKGGEDEQDDVGGDSHNRCGAGVAGERRVSSRRRRRTIPAAGR